MALEDLSIKMEDGAKDCDISNDSVSSEEAFKPIDDISQDSCSPGGIIPAPGAVIHFKKPLLVGPRKGRLKILKLKEPDSNSDTIQVETDELNLKKQDSVHKSPAEIVKECNIPIPYKEPKWSGLPASPYFFEVLKSGTIVEKINLSQKSFHVFGRLAKCDIVMAHPTVSRFHCVLQFRMTGDENSPIGYYLYDLGSTHGTFLNKNKIKPNMYVRVQVGHMIKIGMSSRNYLLQGPASDEEPESELTVTEMKELQVKEKLKAELEERLKKEMEQLEEEQRRKKEEENGIDWGMGEDADEETDLMENPFAATQNEELYINDPKKTLRGWFEREGYDLEYNCDEKGYGQFVCRVELPIDSSRGVPIIAEATVRGKKKEAVVQCALEACRILDQHGLLRQSNHESRKRKTKNWEDNDFYDSDDDTFLDRTGTVEKKRQIRMEQAGVKGNTPVYTYQSLVSQHEEILKEIKRIETELEESTKKKSEEKDKKEEDEDELDAYMSSLSSCEERDKKNISKLKCQLATLRQEEQSVRNLANIAKPAEMPKLSKPAVAQSANKQKPNSSFNKLPMIGKRKLTVKKVVKEFQKEKVEEYDSDEEMDSD